MNNYYTLKNGCKVNYISTKEHNAKLTQVYIHGFGCSIGSNSHILNLELFCQNHCLNFVGFDQLGHGETINIEDKAKEQILLSDWSAQIAEMIKNCVEGDMLVIGFSLGGNLAMICARDYKELFDRVKGFLLQAPGVDFHQQNTQKGLDEVQLKRLEKDGQLALKDDLGNEKVQFKEVIDNEKKLSLFANLPDIGDKLLSLIQGRNDEIVDWKVSQRFSEEIGVRESKFVQLKECDHWLEDDNALCQIDIELERLLKVLV